MWKKDGRKEGGLLGWLEDFASEQRKCMDGEKDIFSL